MSEAWPTVHIHPFLEGVLREANPWWLGEQPVGLPSFKRWAFEPALKSLTRGLTPATELRGPRQVGKTTLLRQIVLHLLDEGIDPRRILHVPFDDLPKLEELTGPILEISRWYAQQILGKTLNQAANDGEKAFILFDEVQNLPSWAPQLKFLVDQNPVRVLVTGSSALRIEAGRDSLAGRVMPIEMGPLLLREVAAIRGQGELKPPLHYNGHAILKTKEFWLELRRFGEQNLEYRNTAFRSFAERGAYPVAHLDPHQPWEQVAETLSETVVRRAIKQDLRLGPTGSKRDENLLREVFRLGCVYIGQSPSQALYLTELRLDRDIITTWQRVLSYLDFLDGTLLLRLIEPLDFRLKKRRGGSKLCLCDHALRAAWLSEVVPLAPDDLQAQPHMADLAGRVAESIVGYFLRSIIGLGVHHFPEREVKDEVEREVDYVVTVGDQRIPVEVKYRRKIAHKDTAGLRSFMEKSHYNAPFALLITQLDESASDDPRIISLPLSTLLLMR